MGEEIERTHGRGGRGRRGRWTPDKLSRKAGLSLLVFAGCSRAPSAPSTGDAGSAADSADSGSTSFAAIDRAENLRRASDIPDAARTAHDRPTRLRVAQALARIADDESAPGLLRALGDEDPEVAAWGAYGLGFSCRGHEAERSAALIARAPSFEGYLSKSPDHPPVDAASAIARALGHCGGDDAEAVLTAWLRDPTRREAAAESLGDAVVAGHPLSEPAIEALIEAASGSLGQEPLAAAFYPLSRVADLAAGPASQLLEAAKATLASPTSAGPWRQFAVRALRKTGLLGIPELARVLVTSTFSPAERSEAARALGSRKDPKEDAAAGEALAAALPTLVPAGDPIAMTALAGDLHGVVTTALAALATLHGPTPKSAEPPLSMLSKLRATGAPDVLERRLSTVRCMAASLLSRGAFDAPLLAACAAPTTEAWERGRLDSLLRRPLLADRKTAWSTLAHSAHPRIREAALEGIATHPELSDAATAAIADALGAGPELDGVVAAAAEALSKSPDRAHVLSRAAKKAALDPRAPIPIVNVAPPTEIDPTLLAKLLAALAATWPAADLETRSNLLAAAATLHLPPAEAAATAACHDASPYLREAAAKALQTLGRADAKCTKGDPPALASELADAPPTGTKAIVFSTDAGDVTIHLDPSLTPVTVAHVLALVRAGTYTNTIVHRVVPGFVVQFGDPGGDGFGGAGPTVRDETSPVPFDALDVGIPLSGRDTGASQLFVTLARTPHLDGAYTRIGHAEGDWAALVEGDAIKEARVEGETSAAPANAK